MKAHRHALLSMVSLGVLATAVWGQSAEHWVSTWAASPQQRVAFPQPPRPPQAPAGGQGQGQPPAPAAAPVPAPGANFNNQTIRMIVHTSIGGRRARVQFSNAYGATALTIRSAHIALRNKDAGILPETDRALSFNGKPSVSIPPGALILSDALDFTVPKLADLAVSVYVPGETGPPTTHATGLHTTYISKEGDFTGTPLLTDATSTQSWYWLSSVDVMAPADAAAIVAFGDSITDGARSTPNTDSSWPSALARRLSANPATPNVAVLNQGISGNRVLREGAATNALARLDRDALSQTGVKWLIFMEGINDIGQGLRANAPADQAVTADDLIGGMKQVIERAHAHGIKVIGATLTPYSGAAYYADAGETVRQAVNQFIRSGAFDAVADFDAVTRDPDSPKQFKAEYDSGDHLHPGDAGYKAMAESIDLGWFSTAKR
jgi:lysophospholipase L1-like esterase